MTMLEDDRAILINTRAQLDDSVDVSVVDVTPELADIWMRNNTHNRNIRRPLVADYARDMAAGRWLRTGDPLRFAADGTVIDGQHRLLAIIRAGVTVRCVVIRGLAMETQKVIDSGPKRTGGDMFKLAGEKQANVTASVAKLVHQYRAGTQQRPTHSELQEILDTTPRLREIINDVLPKLGFTGGSQQMTLVTACYLFWRLEQVSAPHARTFFGQLGSLVDLPDGSPIIALNRRLIAIRRHSASSREYRSEVTAAVFTAWNHWIAGRDLRKIQLTIAEKGLFRVPDPQVPAAFEAEDADDVAETVTPEQG